MVRKLKKTRFLISDLIVKKPEYSLTFLLNKLVNDVSVAYSKPKFLGIFQKSLFFSLHNLWFFDTFNFLVFFYFLKKKIRLLFFRGFFFRKRRKLYKFSLYIFRCFYLYFFISCKNSLKYLRHFFKFPLFVSFRIFLNKFFRYDSTLSVRNWDLYFTLSDFYFKDIPFLSYFESSRLRYQFLKNGLKRKFNSTNGLIPYLIKDAFGSTGLRFFFNFYKATPRIVNISKSYRRFCYNPLLYDCTISLNKNNIFITIYRKIDGRVVTSCSAGNVGFKGKKKKTPPSAQAIALKFTRQVKSKISRRLLKKMQINLKFYGNFTSFLVKEAYSGLVKGGLNFVSLVDCLKKEHSAGIRRKKARRV